MKIIVMAFILSSAAQANVLLFHSGVYESEGVIVEVTKTEHPGYFKIQASGQQKDAKESVNFYFNVFTRKVLASPAGVGAFFSDGKPGVREFVTTKVDDYYGTEMMEFHSGGLFDNHDHWIELEIDPESGDLISLVSDLKISKLGFRSGWHSGPLKKTISNFLCRNLLKRS